MLRALGDAQDPDTRRKYWRQAFIHVYTLFPFMLRTFSNFGSFAHHGNGSTKAKEIACGQQVCPIS